MWGWGASRVSPPVHTSRPMRGGSHTGADPQGTFCPSPLTANNSDSPARGARQQERAIPPSLGEKRGHQSHCFYSEYSLPALRGQDYLGGLLPLRMCVSVRRGEGPPRGLALRQSCHRRLSGAEGAGNARRGPLPSTGAAVFANSPASLGNWHVRPLPVTRR